MLSEISEDISEAASFAVKMCLSGNEFNIYSLHHFLTTLVKAVDPSAVEATRM